MNSGEDAPDEILLDTKGKKVQGNATQYGEESEQERSGGGALEQPESVMNCGG